MFLLPPTTTWATHRHRMAMAAVAKVVASVAVCPTRRMSEGRYSMLAQATKTTTHKAYIKLCRENC